jgi:integrase
MAADAKIHIVKYGGAQARITKRGDGRFVIRWREAKQGRSTTSMSRDGALKLAQAKVRELAGKGGSRTVSVIEAEAVDALKEIAGSRSLSSVVDVVKDAVKRCDGLANVSRAVDAWLIAGHGKLDRSPVSTAVVRFLALHQTSSREHRAGMRKELEAFVALYADMSVCEIDVEHLRQWISRKREDGEEIGERYFNNRLASWKTFLNRCREWGMRVRGEPHPAEVIKKRKEPDPVPEIFTVDQAAKILALIRDKEPQCLNFFVIGCWMGLRPFEMRRITWSMWDWERGYLDIGPQVALKTMQQRFVPIPDNVRAMLQHAGKDAKWGKHHKKTARHCVRTKDQPHLMQLLKSAKILDVWPQDIMRHSYISYRLAQGHGRGQVAEWAGNSENVIRKRYRRPLRKEDGAAWFSVLMPP